MCASRVTLRSGSIVLLCIAYVLGKPARFILRSYRACACRYEALFPRLADDFPLLFRAHTQHFSFEAYTWARLTIWSRSFGSIGQTSKGEYDPVWTASPNGLQCVWLLLFVRAQR